MGLKARAKRAPFPSRPHAFSQKPHKIPGVISGRNDRHAQLAFDILNSEVVQKKVIISDHALRRDHDKIPGDPAFQRIDEIAARQQACDADPRAPEPALYRDDL